MRGDPHQKSGIAAPRTELDLQFGFIWLTKWLRIFELIASILKSGNFLLPCHPEQARSRLILEAKPGPAWLVLG